MLQYKRPVVTSILFFMLFFLFDACQEPTDDSDECGPHQILVDGDCVCDEGFYLNEDQTECLMDTSTHNFIWTIDTLGDQNSFLSGVEIIDNEKFWVVGWLKTDIGHSGGAYYNGSDWEIEPFPGEGWDWSAPMRDIHHISEDTAWIAGGSVFEWDGEEIFIRWLRDGSTDKGTKVIWAKNNTEIFYVGYYGCLIKYDNGNHIEMESGTTLDLLDVYGIREKVFATGHSGGSESVLLEYYLDSWYTKYESQGYRPSGDIDDFGRVYSIWCYKDTMYLATKGGILKESIVTGQKLLLSDTETYIDIRDVVKIRGNNYNDIMWADVWGEMVHYNGRSWHLFSEIYNQYPNGEIIIRSMDYKDNLCVAVGRMGPTAVIIKGVRID